MLDLLIYDLMNMTYNMCQEKVEEPSKLCLILFSLLSEDSTTCRIMHEASVKIEPTVFGQTPSTCMAIGLLELCRMFLLQPLRTQLNLDCCM
jgi:hypothetical protein